MYVDDVSMLLFH